MTPKNLTRPEKEALYILKMNELQRRWKNPIDDDWSMLKEMSDEELDKGLDDVVGQLGFEKGVWWLPFIVGLIVIVVLVILF
ncbi:hypothetical protein IPH19_01995 [Candidatus Uhrbacteria bacterium]|nr:MAG: hypothetical protein IPH19_01995 [Candidatus Uhrbacteria bacterium]